MFAVPLSFIEPVREKNLPDSSEDMPLHWAAQIGGPEVCRLPLENVQSWGMIVNDKGESPLDEAELSGHDDVC